MGRSTASRHHDQDVKNRKCTLLCHLDLSYIYLIYIYCFGVVRKVAGESDIVDTNLFMLRVCESASRVTVHVQKPHVTMPP